MEKLNTVATQRSMTDLMLNEQVDFKDLMHLREAFAEAAAGASGRRTEPFISRCATLGVVLSAHGCL